MSKSWTQTAIESGLEWNVEKRSVYYNAGPEGAPITALIPFRKALVRTDTGEALSVVSDLYRPIQPARIFTALEPIRALTGGTWDSARAFKGGRIIGGTLSLKDSAFSARPGDSIVPNIVFLAGFSGNLGVRYFLSSLRLYCLNILSGLLRSGAKSVSVRHAGDVEARMQGAEETVDSIVRDIAVLKEQIQLLAQTKATPEVASAIIESVLPEPTAPIRYQFDTEGAFYSASEKFQRDHHKWQKEANDILAIADTNGDGYGNGGGSAWDVLNGVTHYFDHVRARRGRVNDSTEYRLFGTGAVAKAGAFSRALEVSGDVFNLSS